jgi:hypothetical protein
MREHGGQDGTTGCGVLSRIAFPAAEATFGARWAARAGPVQGPPAATKFEDYTALTHCGVKPSVHAGCEQNSYMQYMYELIM